MAKKDLEEIVEKINEGIPGKENRFILYQEDHNKDCIIGAYLFEKSFNEEKLNLFEKLEKYIFPLQFHKNKDKALLELGEYMDGDYFNVQYLKILKPNYQGLKELSNKIAKENQLRIL